VGDHHLRMTGGRADEHYMERKGKRNGQIHEPSDGLLSSCRPHAQMVLD